MNKTELKVFLKGLANFYVVLMIIAFLPTPGKDCSPGRLVRCIVIYTIVSIVIFSAVYFWNRIRKGFEPITLTAYMSATLLSKFQIGNETVTIFNR